MVVFSKSDASYGREPGLANTEYYGSHAESSRSDGRQRRGEVDALMMTHSG